MRKQWIILMAAAWIFAFGAAAQAAYVQEVDYDHNIITVGGRVSGFGAGRTVLISVKAPGETEIKFDGTQAFIAATTGTTGSFKTSFELIPKLRSDSYIYTLVISDYEGNQYTEDFYFCPAEELMPVLQSIAAATTGNEISGIIQNNSVVLTFFYKEYNALDANAKADICNGLANYTSFSSVEDFKKAYYAFYIPQALNKANDSAEVLQILTDLEKYNGLSQMKIYPEFLQLPNALKDKVYEFIRGKGDKNSTQMELTFTKGAFLQLLANTSNISSVETLLNTYAGTVGLEISAAKELKEPGKLYADLVGGDFGSIKAAQDEIDRLVKKHGTVSSPKPPATGGGGGSGNGFNASGVVTPEDAGQKPDQETTSEYFNDLGTAAWAKDAIHLLYEKKMVSGYGDGSFRPLNAITREEFAVLAVKAFDLFDENAVCEFDDVSGDAWYYGYVASLYEKGLIRGMGNGAFGSGEMIKRQDAAVILANISSYAELGISQSRTYAGFADEADISDYAEESVKELYAFGVINGSDDGNFYPARPITRAECCVMIRGLLVGNETGE